MTPWWKGLWVMLKYRSSNNYRSCAPPPWHAGCSSVTSLRLAAMSIKSAHLLQ